jgi:hypothetical protein
VQSLQVPEQSLSEVQLLSQLLFWEIMITPLDDTIVDLQLLLPAASFLPSAVSAPNSLDIHWNYGKTE